MTTTAQFHIEEEDCREPVVYEENISFLERTDKDKEIIFSRQILKIKKMSTSISTEQWS